jgi:hypothetical protein
MSNPPSPPGETYLGDGLYASFDGYQIVLRAPRELGNHFVYLEPFVFVRLLRYSGTVWKAQADREGKSDPDPQST